MKIEGNHNEEKSVVLFTHEQNIVYSHAVGRHWALAGHYLGQLLSGHVVGSLPIKSKTNLHRMIMVYSREPIMTRPTVMAANMAGIIYSVETLLQCGLKPDENLVFLAWLKIGVSH